MNHDEQALLRAERRRMAAAFGDVLDEPVPERLTALLAEPAAAPVADLAAARARRHGMSSWAAWGGMAATLVLGTLIGTQLAPPAAQRGDSARLLATGAVAQALERQLAREGGGPVAVQLSFKARDGRWCRSFTTAASAGLACREADGAWALQQVAAADAPAGPGLRQAATPLPPALLAAVDRLIAGAALDAAQEQAARDAGWQR